MAAENADTKKWGLLGAVKAVAIIAVLVILQVVAAAMVIPSPQESEDLARQMALAKKGAELETDTTEAESEAAEETLQEDLVEMRVGQFSITRYNVEADKLVNIDFEVYAAVLATEEADYAEAFGRNQNRVREQINLTIHSAEPADLADRGLGLIKRRILERTNRALGKPLVREVFLTRFNFVQR